MDAGRAGRTIPDWGALIEIDQRLNGMTTFHCMHSNLEQMSWSSCSGSTLARGKEISMLGEIENMHATHINSFQQPPTLYKVNRAAIKDKNHSRSR